MLVDVQFRKPAADMVIILALVGSGGGAIPERISEGMYLSTHWSIDQLGVRLRERWREDNTEFLDFAEYGVCDSPEQAVEKFKLRDRQERFFVSFVRILRANQPYSGGWRWHKWGEYIGDKTPTREYLHDEPEISEVYTFHIYEPL